MEIENKTKNKFWKGVLVGVLVTAFAGLLIVGAAAGILLVGRTVIDNQMEQIVESSGTAGERKDLDYDRIQAKLQLLQRIMNQYYLFDEDPEVVESYIYKGMMAGLEDPYTVYYTPEEYEKLTETTEGVYCGIGALVSQSIETGIVTILRVFPDSPAEESGLLKGDIIYTVNGIEASSEDLDLLVQEEIRGEEGTSVKLEVVRGGETLEFTVIRRSVEVATVEHQMLSDGQTGYIMVSQFDVVTAEQFRTAVDDLESQGMRQMVIDLRDNPGGVLDAVLEVAAYLLPEGRLDGTIVSTADKYGKGSRYFCEDGKLTSESNNGSDGGLLLEDGHEVQMPIVVLINGNSASASEVLAGALQDYGWAKLVGTTTFGKGIVQSLIPLDDGSAIKITTSHYYTPKGFDLHGKGLDPDVEVEFELPKDHDPLEEVELEEDNQLQKALEVLKEAG